MRGFDLGHVRTILPRTQKRTRGFRRNTRGRFATNTRAIGTAEKHSAVSIRERRHPSAAAKRSDSVLPDHKRISPYMEGECPYKARVEQGKDGKH